MRCVIDSCVFIESFKGKGRARDLLICAIEHFQCFIIGVIFSEVFYKLVGLKAGISPMTLKKKKAIATVLKSKDLVSCVELLLSFEVLEENGDVIAGSYKLMCHHNLLPNDALILATCKHYDIKYLVSLDSDFEKPCEKEGIVLIDSAERLMEVLDGRDSD